MIYARKVFDDRSLKPEVNPFTDAYMAVLSVRFHVLKSDIVYLFSQDGMIQKKKVKLYFIALMVCSR